MKLRVRLALTITALVIPVALLLVGVQHRMLQRTRVSALVDVATERMLSGGRDVCESDPARFSVARATERARAGQRARQRRARGGANRGGMAARDMRARRRMRRWARPGRAEGLRRGVRVFPYDADLNPSSPNAPSLPPALVADIEGGAPFAWRRVRGDANRAPRHEVLVPMPWSDGPCATLLLRSPAPADGLATSALVGVLVGLFAALIAGLAVGPLVRRIRVLTGQVARDEPITTRKPARDEIDQLALGFASQRARIEEQIAELEARDAALVNYVANTTHDVMLPLTVLQGHLVAARDAAGTEAPRLDAAIEESHYLASLLRNLNAAARLDAATDGVSQLPVELGALVERVIARHAPIAERGRIELVHAAPTEGVTVVSGDETLLERLLSNLVHNAVRYNEPGGHVAVILERVDTRFRLRVLDDGPGLDDLSRLGERGFRSDAARTRRPGGMGLGLHIASDVAARHGMALRFEHARDVPDGPERGLSVTLEGPLRG